MFDNRARSERDTARAAPRWHSKVATGARQDRVRHSPADNTHRKVVR